MRNRIEHEKILDQLSAYKTMLDDIPTDTPAHYYQAANRISNDFLLLNQIIQYRKSKELYALVREDILFCRKYAFARKSSSYFSLKHKTGILLLATFPQLYNLMIRIKIKTA